MLYTFYGDDFTGSTDVLETLGSAGVPSVLFLRTPTPDDLAGFPPVQAIGIAGDSRSRSPQWMDENLPIIFATLRRLNAPIAHYKTCSTFDSAPEIGSIGRALELGIASFHSRFVPIVVAAPHLGRYVLFGKLYARSGTETYRIDLHPTMSRHPVTPMLEPDLRKHLAQQTSLPVALLDVRNISAASLEASLKNQPAAVLFDGFDDATSTLTGHLLWQEASSEATPNLFAVGSSGLTESLIPAWRSQLLIPPSFCPPEPSAVDQIVVISGSCSPTTEAQINLALAHGFSGIPVDPAALIRDPRAHTHALDQALAVLAEGRSPILYTALGPLAPSTPPHTADLGSALGKLLRAILERTPVRRAVLCGGDTSSHAVQQLPLFALTWKAPLSPGAPLCLAHSHDARFQHLKLVLKGGQLGSPDFFLRARGSAITAT